MGRSGGIGKQTISHAQELGPLGENGVMESYRKLEADRDEWKRKYEENEKQLRLLQDEIKDMKQHIANYCVQPYKSEGAEEMKQ